MEDLCSTWSKDNDDEDNKIWFVNRVLLTNLAGIWIMSSKISKSFSDTANGNAPRKHKVTLS